MKNLILTILSILTLGCGTKESSTEPENLRHFKFIIADTLQLGANLARVAEYNREIKENERAFIAVIIENELKNGAKQIDTFSDGLKTPFFVISRYKIGKQKLKIKVEEKMTRTKKLPNDSFNLEIKDIYYTYEFNVFVKDKDYKSELNDILSKQMDIEYAENLVLE